LPNPFVTGNPIQPEYREVFVGRRDIIEQIQTEALREGGAGAILFLGNRRTGKTSTLLNLQSQVGSGIKPVFIDCQSPLVSGGTLVDFSGKLAATVLKATVQRDESITNFQTFADLTRLLEKLQLKFYRQGIRSLLCFDEYERLTTQITNGALSGLPDSLRYWIQHLPNFIFLFAGSHPLTEISDLDWSDYLINVRTVPISYLDFDSALHLITKPVPEYNLTYEPEDVAGQLISRLGGQPYLLQAVMFELTEHLNAKHQKNRPSGRYRNRHLPNVCQCDPIFSPSLAQRTE